MSSVRVKPDSRALTDLGDRRARQENWVAQHLRMKCETMPPRDTAVETEKLTESPATTR